MTFNVAADAYGRFMGRYSEPLSTVFADWVGVRAGQSALDVGCGPGALTQTLVDRLGVANVSAADPSPPFVEAVSARFPGLVVHRAPAEQLPFDDGAFDVTLAQLVVHFMQDPVTGVAEMARVTRPGGVVAACTWDLAGDRSPLNPLWSAARRLDPRITDESHLAGAREGQLAAIARDAGLRDVESGEIAVTVIHPNFDEWWEPFTLGVGPAGEYVKSLDDDGREALREEARRGFPAEGPFEITAVAWAVRGLA
ncbi:class I SAM-dependent methyltransferase [Knoellia subterranea]|uniref:SAM-dependent methlyltransferase n=1 Tax=Knoellia subterranea KCTC 19937 TaxID=1385521 RepID=A0A0A0JLC3_9MICO|nr:class I SAM-dependent methyltransferase [Knoellia subterranea]KGN37514.1 SAM-dependent methlyltransferase [Knoellia subterranea KCTC 19937]